MMSKVKCTFTVLLISYLHGLPVIRCATTPVSGSSLPWRTYVDGKNQLRTDLLNSNYSRRVRPADKLNVTVRYNLLAVNSIDMKTQTFSTSGWLTMKWYDLRLTWDKELYHNISYMFDTEDALWRPEIIIDNSVDTIGVIHDSALLLRVRYDGQVMWEPPGIHTVHCEIDSSYYPFDGQKCALDIASWTYNIDEVELQHMTTGVNLQDYMVNGEWSLLGTSLVSSQLVEEEEIFSQLKFIFHLHRRPFYYVINIIIPIGLTSVLSIIVFILPFESGEKVSYSLTVLLSYAVLMTIVANNMPSTSIKVSVLSIYLALILFVGCTSVIFSVINLYIYHQKPERPVPSLLKKFTRAFLLKKQTSGDNKPRKNSNGPKIVPAEDEETRYQRILRDQERNLRAREKEGKLDDKVEKCSWNEIAIMLDTFLFKIYMVLVVMASVLFFVVMTVGGYYIEPSMASHQAH